MPTTKVKIIGSGVVAPLGLRFGVKPECMDTPCDVAPFLKERKGIKLMAKQDRMALLAAAIALKNAGLSANETAFDTGLYLCIGILPFDQAPLDLLAQKSEINGHFDMVRFSSEALMALNPLLTFQCLPNMPAFHISYNLGMHGRYLVTYPGTGQWVEALMAAMADLEAGRVKFAVVGAVADQRNALVYHQAHFMGLKNPDLLIDSAAMLVIARNDETPVIGGSSLCAQLSLSDVSYEAFDPAVSQGPFGRPNACFAVEPGPVAPSLGISLLAGSRDGGRIVLDREAGVSAVLEVNPV